jgi:hypothetical protein
VTNAVRAPALDAKGPRVSDQLGSSISPKHNHNHPFRQGRFQHPAPPVAAPIAPPVAAQARQRRLDAAWGVALEEFGGARGNRQSLSSIRHRRQYESFRDRRPNWRAQS